ncbi:Paired amphipathic helix protein Sin3-like 3, partial [Dictyocoela muelleri]
MNKETENPSKKIRRKCNNKQLEVLLSEKYDSRSFNVDKLSIPQRFSIENHQVNSEIGFQNIDKKGLKLDYLSLNEICEDNKLMCENQYIKRKLNNFEIQERSNETHESLNETHESSNKTQEYSNETHESSNKTQEYSNAMHESANETHENKNVTHESINVTHEYSNEIHESINETHENINENKNVTHESINVTREINSKDVICQKEDKMNTSSDITSDINNETSDINNETFEMQNLNETNVIKNETREILIKNKISQHKMLMEDQKPIIEENNHESYLLQTTGNISPYTEKQKPFDRRDINSSTNQTQNTTVIYPKMMTTHCRATLINQDSNIDLTQIFSFLKSVKKAFTDDPSLYDQFLELLRDFRSNLITIDCVVKASWYLFKNHAYLNKEFAAFLPEGYDMYDKIMNELKRETEIQREESYINVDINDIRPRLKTDARIDYENNSVLGPMQFISCVKGILKNEPTKYHSFLKTLNNFMKKKITIENTISSLKKIIGDHPDLIRE